MKVINKLKNKVSNPILSFKQRDSVSMQDCWFCRLDILYSFEAIGQHNPYGNNVLVKLGNIIKEITAR